jgi:hypothetical protein
MAKGVTCGSEPPTKMIDASQSDAERARRIGLWLITAGTLALWLPEVLTRPLFGDDSFYLWAARQMAHGHFPIRDFYCIDTAGMLACFSLLGPLIGSSSVAYWLVLATIVLVTASLLGGLVSKATPVASASAWTVFVFSIAQFYLVPAYALAGKDLFGFPFLLAGLLLAAHRRWWPAAHLIMGVGIAIKPTLGAIWLTWIFGQLWLARAHPRAALLRTSLATLMMGAPFLAATLWAEQHGWGWAMFRTELGLTGGHYGTYLSVASLYKLANVLAPVLWLLPLAVVGAIALRPYDLAQHLPLLAVLIGGAVNAGVQPMFDTWYFTPLVGGVACLASIGIARMLREERAQALSMLAAGLFVVFVPSTNLRWLKLLFDKGYNLQEHQSRVIVGYNKNSATPIEQAWVRGEVIKLIGERGKVGVLVDDANLLWALWNYEPAYWAVRCPSWHPERLVEGISSRRADVIVGVEQPRHRASAIYTSRTAQLWWPLPPNVVKALTRNYRVAAESYGYVVYVRKPASS